MASDSTAAKKKRINRSAKLKQCKLDARREQWLSQVKERETADLAPSRPPPGERRGRGSCVEDPNGEGNGMVKLDSGNRRRNNSTADSLSSGSSLDSCSRSASDAEEGDCEENGVLDDWEAVADALNGDQDDDRGDPVLSTDAQPGGPVAAQVVSEPRIIRSEPKAWTAGDAARPQSLPSLAKQWSFPTNFERQYCLAQQKCVLALPLSCPICCEDLDPTDTSFLPCSCGFRLCLFCHKRILEADSRCPGCRKQYETNLGSKGSETCLPFRLPRCCSMNARV